MAGAGSSARIRAVRSPRIRTGGRYGRSSSRLNRQRRVYGRSDNRDRCHDRVGPEGDAVRLSRSGLLTGVAVLALVSFGFIAQAPRELPPHLADPTATGSKLVTRFFNLIEHNDAKGLQRFLSPAFQLQRADGSGGTKAEYLANLPTITEFSISDVTATQTGSVLIVRYLTTAEGVVNGRPYTPGPAPRLSVFSRIGKTWRLVAHANFNPLTG
jgi:Domain of unknown function (DUF4440)